MVDIQLLNYIELFYLKFSNNPMRLFRFYKLIAYFNETI